MQYQPDHYLAQLSRAPSLARVKRYSGLLWELRLLRICRLNLKILNVIFARALIIGLMLAVFRNMGILRVPIWTQNAISARSLSGSNSLGRLPLRD